MKQTLYAFDLEAHSALMKTLYLSLSGLSMVLTSLGLEVDVRYIFLAIGGSLAGSFILSYFRREKSWFDASYKLIVSAVAGLISGGILVKYYGYTEAEYIAGIYALCACLVLFFMRSVVGVAESNAGTIVTTVFQRVFNISADPKLPKDPRPRSRKSMPSVVPERSEAPNVQVVETQIIQTEEK